MTPPPQEHAATHQDGVTMRQLDGCGVVISGMSGLYPQSHNVKEFSDILYNKVNPVTQKDLRFKYDHPEVVQHTGTIPGANRFDAQFFKVYFRLAFSMDPMARKVLEQAYQAIYDSGVNPEYLSGKKVGVYIGSCFSETEKTFFYVQSKFGLGIAGCSKTMFANRISYWLNAKGPSMSIDAACCSSTAALEQAYLAITSGACEAAIVGGCYLCLHPQSFLHNGRVIKLCSDGKTKSFDEHADGCAKSEAINILFLQKAKDALRIYAHVVHVKSEFTCVSTEDTGPKYGFYRTLSSTANFIKTFYEDARVPPQAIEYVEAFGSALPEADKIELQVFEEVFCKNRDDPLFVGSVMSNIGYGEAASGLSAITKVLLGYHHGKMAANLHCEHPRQDIVAIREGRMRIITEHQSFRNNYVAVNGMSITGLNTHVLLHGHQKQKDLNRYKSNIPHMVTMSGRHEEAVNEAFEILKSSQIDPEQLALLHNIHRTSIPGHLSRGFIILDTNEKHKTVSLRENAEYFDDARRPLWFVYSGMGSQWAGMGLQLMRIPIFSAAVERCRKALEPMGLDIIHIITSPDKTVFDNILHSFVGIAAIQIGLTDILHALGLNPDGIIGHSVGELGCAYADGCLTAEEMILSAYYRGMVSLETKFIHGSMAAVGMGYEKISKICPPEIEVACHNGPESSTLSGPSDVMREFVAELTGKGIFAREVPCSNIAYHSRYIADAGPKLLKYLKEAIHMPKARSERWISSSIPKDRWDEPIAKLCSAEYLTNNLLSPVLFEETLRLIPNNAVLVEIAPHGLLQAILKRSMPSLSINIPLTRRNHPDNTIFLLEAIGKLYMEGYNTDVQVLYPKVEMPVSTGTPFLSHLIKWAHGEHWPLSRFNCATKISAANCDFVVTLHDHEYAFLKGHRIRGNTVYPFAASLTLAWDTLAMIRGVSQKQLSVEFSDVQLYAQPVLHNRRQLKLSVAVHRGSGRFEILDGISKVANGFINPLETKDAINNEANKKTENMYFTAQDIYQLLRDREYSYSGEFQSIKGVNESLSDALLLWKDNWVTFLDGMLQLNMLRQAHDAASLPTRVRRILIDVNEHTRCVPQRDTSDNTVLLAAKISEELDNTRCGGVLMESVHFKNLPPVSESKLAVKSLMFVPNTQSKLDVVSLLEVYFQIVAENVNKDIITVVGVPSQIKEVSMFKSMNNALRNMFRIKVNYKQLTRESDLENYDFSGVDLVLVQNLSTDQNVLRKLQQILQRDQFVATEEDITHSNSSKSSPLYRVIFVRSFVQNQLELRLLRWGSIVTSIPTTTISVRNQTDFKFLSSVRSNLAVDHRLFVITPYPSPPGVKKLISNWRKEAVRNKLHLITINNDCVDNLEEKLRDIEQAFNVVDYGVLGGEFYLPMKENVTVSKNVTLQSAQFGDYDSLTWVDAPELAGPGVIVTVHFAGINSNDINTTSGSFHFKQNIENSYGSDFSGITKNGERVMGMVSTGAASTQVRAQPELLWPVPDHWRLEEAATVPLAHMQAFYCLGIKTKLNRGMTVLVHGGAGALGQAVISIALAHNCKVFTTVSDTYKKYYLLNLFPALKAEHIGNSRDHTFAEMVLSATNDEGCDIIISCVKGHLKDISLKCTAVLGTCLDVSQLQNQDNFAFGMYNINDLNNYSTIDFSSIFAADNMSETRILHNMVSEGIARGYVRPLSRVTYAPHEVPRAFRLLATSQHRGRVLLRMKDNILQTQYRLRCSADRSHFVFCDRATFGLQFADRLVARGVKKLCLHMPTQSSYLQHKIGSWRRSGIRVVVFTAELNEHDISTMLSEASHVGPLEGVYIITGSYQDKNGIEQNIKLLDLELRKMCSQLSYFAVICAGDDSAGKHVCLHRIRDQLPATFVTLPELMDESYTEEWRSVVDAVEHALQNTRGILLAHRQNNPRPSLLQELTKLAGIDLPDEIQKNLTLQELGVESHKLKLICNFLQVQHNLALDKEQVALLTINKILELGKIITELPYDDVKGLQTFFSYIDSDELLATTDFVFLRTLVNASVSDNEVDPDQKNLCIIPGMEGHHERFRVLCERLKIPALVLQPGLDHPLETLEETAARFVEVLLKKTGLKDKFYLLGYESGVPIALEIAAILEDHGLTGTVFCLGCAPEELKQELEDQLSEFETEKQLQDGVLRHMYTLMAGSDTTRLEKALQNVDTWSQKVDTCVRILLGRMSHSAQYARALIECALARIQQVARSTARVRLLHSKLILLRAAHDPPGYTSLQQHSRQPLVVHQLTTGLAHVTSDLHCATLINEHLDPVILEDFATRNICDTYLLNPEAYMAE